MAATMKCFLHTARDAMIRCKQCGKPLCHECRKTTDIGVFCSDECYAKTKNFTTRAAEYDKSKSNYWKIKALVKRLVILVILLGVIWWLWDNGYMDQLIQYIKNLI